VDVATKTFRRITGPKLSPMLRIIFLRHCTLLSRKALLQICYIAPLYNLLKKDVKWKRSEKRSKIPLDALLVHFILMCDI